MPIQKKVLGNKLRLAGVIIGVICIFVLLAFFLGLIDLTKSRIIGHIVGRDILCFTQWRPSNTNFDGCYELSHKVKYSDVSVIPQSLTRAPDAELWNYLIFEIPLAVLLSMAGIWVIYIRRR